MELWYCLLSLANQRVGACGSTWIGNTDMHAWLMHRLCSFYVRHRWRLLSFAETIAAVAQSGRVQAALRLSDGPEEVVAGRLAQWRHDRRFTEIGLLGDVRFECTVAVLVVDIQFRLREHGRPTDLRGMQSRWLDHTICKERSKIGGDGQQLVGFTLLFRCAE